MQEKNPIIFSFYKFIPYLPPPTTRGIRRRTYSEGCAGTYSATGEKKIRLTSKKGGVCVAQEQRETKLKKTRKRAEAQY
jgi:hypothetical protein